MCEILIFAANNTNINPDPEKDRRGCYKRGMVVVVKDDGHLWGREESKAVWIAEGRDLAQWSDKFVIVRLPGVPAAKADELLAEQMEDDTGVPTIQPGSIALAGGPYPWRFRRRRWRLDMASLPPAIRNALIADGEFTANTLARRRAIRDALKRVRDAAQYTGLD